MSPIDIFIWSEKFNTGLQLVDEQHRRLVELINEVAGELVFAPDEARLRSVLTGLVDYAEYHFRCEEELWSKHLRDLPAEAAHRDAHKAFAKDVQRIVEDAKQPSLGLRIEALLDYLVRWLAAHILESDRRFAHMVLAIEEGAPLELAKARADELMQGSTRVMIDIILGVYTALSHNTLLLMRELLVRGDREKQLQLAASVFESAHEGIMITDPKGVILEVNEAFTRISGYSRNEAIGANPRLLKSDRHGSEFFRGMWRSLLESGTWSGEIWGRRKDGELFAKHQTINAVRDEDGQILRFVALFSDITALKAHQEQLEHVTYHDPLTHLPNRVLLVDRLQQALVRAQRRRQQVAVVALDLDDFQQINDRYGHAVGDRLLIQLADRIKQNLREVDTLARLGGDEFVLVLPDLVSFEAVQPILERLQQGIAQPVLMEGHAFSATASLGVSAFLGGDSGGDADLLLRQASQAMFQAKQAGKNRIVVFDAAQDRLQRGRVEQVARFRQALEQGELVLHYQPKVHMRSGALVGVEALVRWQHPKRGLLPPGQFLPFIEGDPLCIELDRWVLKAALQQLTDWRAAGQSVPISVNISAAQLSQPRFLEELRGALQRHPEVRPGDLEIEVLETSALEDLVHVASLIEGCRALGVRVALDDFGTGYSSLAYLKQLAADLLKVDQSFVRDCLEDSDDLAILDAVLSLARAFRCQALAEGVETVAHGELLLMLGYELAQGYAIARPMPPQELSAWRARWCPDSSWQRSRRLSRDDLPVLVACVDHRAWVETLRRHLEGYQAQPPELGASDCLLGQWLQAERHSGPRAADPRLADIEAIHSHIHLRARQLLAKPRVAGGFDVGALREIESLRDALVAALMALVSAPLSV